MAKKTSADEKEQKTDPEPTGDRRPETDAGHASGCTVRLKPGHPTGVYRRAGLEFSAAAPTYLDDVPDAVAADPWLVVSYTNVENLKLREGKNDETTDQPSIGALRDPR